MQPSRVVVRMIDGASQAGTLLCIGADDFVLAGATVTNGQLSSVREIVRPADPVWDGALKGVAVPLIVLVLCGGECASPEFLRGVLAYGLLGMAIDAIEPHRDVFYRAGSARPALRMKWRF